MIPLHVSLSPVVFLRFVGAIALAAATVTPAAAQTPPPAEPAQDTASMGRRIEGTVVSVRRGSFTLRTSDGRYRVFELGSATPARPLRPGMRIAVVTQYEDDTDAPRALAIVLLPADTANPATGPTATGGTGDPVPAEVRAMEVVVERQLRRYNAGVAAGVSVQPELIIVGAHATFERIFRRPVSFRPSLQFGFGELTTMAAIDLDVLYTFPGATRRTRWAPYVGAGPTFAFRHRSLEGEDDDGNRFDFGDSDDEIGVNFIVGMRNRNGTFFEMKATASGISDVRLLAGVTF
jgi:hypothetical protein